MKLTRFISILGLCGVLLSACPTVSFAYDCNSDCKIYTFGILDPFKKAACESEKALKGCGIKIPTIADIFNDIKSSIESLITLPCALPFQTYTSGVYNSCVNVGNGFTDIANAPRNVQLAAAILTDLRFYQREDFNNVKIIWCGNIGIGAEGMVPVPDRILLLSAYKDKAPKNDPYYWSETGIGSSITGLLGHEMTHIMQLRSLGHQTFACNYSSEILGGRFDGANTYEKEAYDREREINRLLSTYKPSKTPDQLINDFLHPPVPPPPPTQAQTNAALAAAITPLLLEMVQF